jgi:deoxycytidine triphosphate deaminase
MSIKPDTWITRMARDHKMIEPFVDDQVRAGVISYGVSSYGYDVRVGDQFKVFTNVFNTLVDPKHFDRSRSSTSRPTSASSRPIPSPWRAPSSISGFRATC